MGATHDGKIGRFVRPTPISALQSGDEMPANRRPRLRVGSAALSAGVDEGPRSFHLVDWRSMSQGEVRLDRESVSRLWDAYAETSGFVPGELGVLGAGARVLVALPGTSVPRFRLLVAAPLSSGDVALPRAGYEAVATGRFDQIVIGSGSGGFAFFAEHCLQHGLRVIVVSRAGKCSRFLQSRASEVRFLSEGPIAA